MADNLSLDQTPGEDLVDAGPAPVEDMTGSGRSGRKNGRPTIGLLVDNVQDAVARDVWAGVEAATQRRDANLLCVVGGALGADVESVDPANVVYDLVGEDNVDGLVVWAGGLGQNVAVEDVKAFCERYQPLPVVSAGRVLDGLPSVVVDNYDGMRQVLLHLVEIHGHRRIAFVRGPASRPDAEERYRAYIDVLAESGLVLDPTLVVDARPTQAATPLTETGRLDSSLGAGAVRVLLDERGLTQGRDFEVLVAFDDETSIRAVEALQERGVRVPREVAVVGFGNLSSGAAISPPLTTVPSLVYEQARRAAEMVLALVRGRTVREQVTLSTELIVRQSCGCLDPAIAQAEVGAPEGGAASGGGAAFETALTVRRTRILSEMAEAAGPVVKGLDPRWAEHLLAVFAVEAGGEAPGAFLSTLERTLGQVVRGGGDVGAWQNVISRLRQNVRPALENDVQALTRAENLWQQARVMVAGAAERGAAYRALQRGRQDELLRDMDRALMTAADVRALADVLAQRLPRLGAARGYVARFEGASRPAQRAEIVVGYAPGGRMEVVRFASRDLVPGGLPWREERSSMVLDPLVFQDRALGYAVLELGPEQAEIHAPLPAQLGGALYRLSLVRQEAGHAVQLQTGAEVSRVAGGILELDELMRQAVDLIRERFGLYYVGLFLIDEAGEWTEEPGTWAVLRSGTGEAGQAMVEAGHKLEVGSESMIGWCTANAEARIALDVGREAVRFENPFLPLTRSEMALPLVSHGRVIGAMSIQSERASAFGQDDIIALQTMADQLANAVENARLFEGRERQITELSIVNEIGQVLGTTMGLDELLQNVHHQVSRLFDTTSFYIATYNEGDDQWCLAYRIEEGERIEPTWHDLGAGLTGYMILNRQSLLFRTAQDIVDFHNREGMAVVGVTAKSWLGVPLVTADKVVGVMAIQDYGQERLYDGQDLALFSTVAAQVATALDNLSLLHRLRQRAEEMGGLHHASQEVAQRRALLNEMSEALIGAADQQEILNVAATRAGQIFGASRASVAMLTEDRTRFEIFALHGDEGAVAVGEQLAAAERPIGIAVRKQRLVTIPDDQSGDLGGIRSSMVAPLITGRGAIGTLNVGHPQPNAYDEADGELLMQVASLLSAALENRRLFEEAQIAAQDQATLRSVTEAVSRSLEMDTLLDAALDTVLSSLGFDSALVSLTDEASGDLLLVAEQGLPEAMARTLRQDGLAGTLCDVVFQTGETVAIGDVREGAPVNVEGVINQGLIAYAGVPLAYQEQRIGTICAFGRAPREFSARELMLLEGVGAQLGVGVANARLFEEIQRRLGELEAINEVGQTITSVLDVDALLRQVVDITRMRFGYYHASIMLVEDGKLVFRDGSTVGDSDARFEPGEVTIDLGSERSLNAEAVRTGQPVLVNDVLKDARFLPIAELPHTRAELDVPIEVKGEVIGVLCVQSDRPFAFGRSDVALLQSLALQVGIAIDNARLFGLEQDALGEAQDATLQLGQRVQELNILNDIGRKIDESPDIPEFLDWVTSRIPQAMQRPDKCVSAVEYGDDVYGADAAVTLPHQIVQGLYAGGERVGRLFIAYTEETDFINVESALMGDISRRVSGYIENRQLLDETQRSAEELVVLNELSHALTTRLSVEEVLDETYRQTSRLLDTTNFYIGLYDEKKDEIHFIVDYTDGVVVPGQETAPAGENGAELEPVIISGTEGMAGHIIRTRQPILLEDDVIAAQEGLGVAPVGRPSLCFLGVPLLVGEQVLGAMAVQSYTTPRLYGEHERDLLTAIAGSVAIAFQNARLFVETEESLAETESLYGASRMLASAGDLQEVVAAVAEGVYVPAVNRAVLWGIERDAAGQVEAFATLANWYSGDGTAPLPLGTRFPVAQFPATSLVLAEEPIFVDNIPEDPRIDTVTKIAFAQQKAVAMAVLPLWLGSVQTGLLMLVAEEPHHFTADEIRPYRSLAGQVAIAVENRRLFEQTQRQLADLDTIQMTMSQLTAALTSQEAIDALLPQVAGIALAETVVMYVVDGDYMLCSGVYSTVDRPDLTVGQIDILDDYPSTKQALETRQPLALLADDPRLQPHAQEAYEEPGIVASATIPLVGREDVVGFLALHRYRPDPGSTGPLAMSATGDPVMGFTDQQINLVATLADQATVAIEKSRLLEDVQHRTLQLQTAAEVSQAASSILSVQELVEESVGLIRDRYDFYYVGLFLLDEDGGYAELRAGTGEAGRIMVERKHRLRVGGESMIGQCVSKMEARIALDVGDEAARFDNPLLPETRSEMALPLVSRGQAQGALTVQSKEAAAFSEEDVTVLQSMADQLANAIANAGLYAQAQQAAQRSQALYETSSALSTHMEEEPLLRTILEGIYQTLACEHVSVSTVDQEAQTISIRHILSGGEFDVYPEWIEQGSFPLDHPDILADVCRTGLTEIIGEWDERFDREIWERWGHERFLRVFAPIKMRDTVLGAIEVAYDKRRKAVVTEEEVALLAAFIDQAASALQQVRLFERTQAALSDTEALYQVSRSITVAQDVDQVLEAVLAHARRLDLDRCLVALLDDPDVVPADRKVEVRAVWDGQDQEALYLGNRFTPETLPFVGELGPADRLVHKDLTSAKAPDGRTGTQLQQFDVGAAAIVPLAVGGRVLGWLMAETVDRPRAFSELELDALQSVAGQAAVAIQGMRQLEAIEARARREQILREITTQVRGSTDPDAILRAAVRELGTALGRPAFVRLGESRGPENRGLETPPTVGGDGGGGGGE